MQEQVTISAPYYHQTAGTILSLEGKGWRFGQREIRELNRSSTGNQRPRNEGQQYNWTKKKPCFTQKGIDGSIQLYYCMGSTSWAEVRLRNYHTRVQVCTDGVRITDAPEVSTRLPGVYQFPSLFDPLPGRRKRWRGIDLWRE